MNEDHLSLSELNSLIKEAIELNFVDGCWVVAEIASLKMAAAGHCYLELVEKNNNKVKAKLRANCWSFVYQSIAPKFFRVTGQPLQEGMKVLLFCEVSFHELYGVSLTVKSIDPNYTLGEMARRKKEILDRLEKEGLLTKNKRFELPLVIQRVAVISSETAAGYEDFMNQMENNDFGFQFYYKLFPATMQGEKTVGSIISALNLIREDSDKFDVVIIIRGGGSTIDLNSFDSYELGKEVANFELPILSGIGHERDDSVVDFVANTRLKTPTAVANFIIDKAADFLSNINEFKSELIKVVQDTIESEKRFLDRSINSIQFSGNKILHKQKILLNRASERLPGLSRRLLMTSQNELSNSFSKISFGVKSRIKDQESEIERKIMKIKFSVSQTIDKNKSLLKENAQMVRLNDPVRLLDKGYSIVYKEGKIQKSIKELKKNDELTIHLRDGKVNTKII